MFRKPVFGRTLLVSVLLFAVSCKGKKQDYAKCEYETVTTLAKVVNMKPHADGGGKIAVVLQFDGSPLALENQELGELKGLHIDHDFLVRNNIEMGNKYEVIVTELIRGECETKLTVAFNHSFE